MAQRIVDELHNTPDEVGQWLSDALAIIAEQELQVDDHPALLVKVLELLASRTIQFVVAQPTPLDPGLARRLGLDGRGH